MNDILIAGALSYQNTQSKDYALKKLIWNCNRMWKELITEVLCTFTKRLNGDLFPAGQGLLKNQNNELHQLLLDYKIATTLFLGKFLQRNRKKICSDSKNVLPYPQVKGRSKLIQQGKK